MMRIYRAPDGYCYQYREGKAPDGYVLVEPTKADEQPEDAPKPKRRRAANKARKTEDK